MQTEAAAQAPLVRIHRAEMRQQVEAFLNSIEAGRYDTDGAYAALLGRFGAVTVASASLRDEFWQIIDRHELAASDVRAAA